MARRNMCQIINIKCKILDWSSEVGRANNGLSLGMQMSAVGALNCQ